MGLSQPTKMGKMGHLWGAATHLSEKWQIATHPKRVFVKWLKTLEKRLAAGISGCCDRKVGAIATHLAFSCLFLDPPTQGRVVVNAGANISPSCSYRGFGAQSCPFSLLSRKRRHGATTGFTRAVFSRSGKMSCHGILLLRILQVSWLQNEFDNLLAYMKQAALLR